MLHLVRRLKRAYHANRIPVDRKTEDFLKTLTPECLRENALYWERKAGLAPPEEGLTIHEATRIIRTVGGTPPVRSQTAVAVAAAEYRYHGSSYWG